MDVGTLQDLFAHQVWADAALLRALSSCEAAASDTELLTLSPHVVTVHRFFVLTCMGQPNGDLTWHTHCQPEGYAENRC